jgi:hypothetical protein
LKKIKREKIKQSLAASIEQLHKDLSAEMAKVLRRARENSKIDYTGEEVSEIIRSDRNVIDSFPILMDIGNIIHSIFAAITNSNQEALENWKKITINDRTLVVETIDKIARQQK